jgi:hypothetical protein
MNDIQGVTLQALGRWKSPKMVMRYAHLSGEYKKKSVNTLGSLFDNEHKLNTNLVQADFSKVSGND